MWVQKIPKKSKQPRLVEKEEEYDPFNPFDDSKSDSSLQPEPLEKSKCLTI